MGKFKKPEQKTESIQVGGWLFQDMQEQSKETAGFTEQTMYIDMDQIEANSRNEFSKEELEDLAQSIKLAGGIWQNLIVKPKDERGIYTLTTGERRWRAAKLLRDNGEYPEKFENKVPCTIRNPQNLDLPLSDNSKEMFSILVTNKYRDKTDGDRMMEYREWKAIFDELRKQGIAVLYSDGTFATKEEAEVLDGVEGKDGMQIAGVKTRKLLADSMNISTGQVARFENVNRRASEQVMESLLSNKINLGEAEQLAQLPQSEQDEIIKQENKDGVKLSETAKKHKELYTAKKSIPAEELLADVQSLQDMIPQDDVELTEEQYKKYKKCITELRKIFM